MSAHTPGPWSYSRVDSGVARGLVYCRIHGPHRRPLGFAGTYSDKNRIPEKEAESNARLIAAAPELLEALAKAERKLSAYVGVCKDDKELTNTILPMIRAAIAKAEGR